MLEAVVVLVAPVGRAPVASYRSAAEEEQGSAAVVRCYSTLVWYATSLCYGMVRYMLWYGMVWQPAPASDNITAVTDKPG